MKRSTLIAAGLLVAVGSSIWFGCHGSSGDAPDDTFEDFPFYLTDNERMRRSSEAYIEASDKRMAAESAAGYRTFLSASGLWYQPLPGFKLVAVPDAPPKSPNAKAEPQPSQESPVDPPNREMNHSPVATTSHATNENR